MKISKKYFTESTPGESVDILRVAREAFTEAVSEMEPADCPGLEINAIEVINKARSSVSSVLLTYPRRQLW